MKIKLNSFAAAISVVFTLLTVALYFFSFNSIPTGISISYEVPFLNPVYSELSRLAFILYLAAPLLQLCFTLFCRRNALPALLLPVCCLFAANAIIISEVHFAGKFNYKLNLFVLIATIVFALTIVLCACFYKNASKTGLSILFFSVTVAFIISILLSSYRVINSDLSVFLGAAFFSEGMLCLALKPKTLDLKLPAIEEIDAQPDICVKVESPKLAQTLDALLDSYNKGKISKEEYEALKRETLWKI